MCLQIRAGGASKRRDESDSFERMQMFPKCPESRGRNDDSDSDGDDDSDDDSDDDDDEVMKTSSRRNRRRQPAEAADQVCHCNSYAPRVIECHHFITQIHTSIAAQEHPGRGGTAECR